MIRSILQQREPHSVVPVLPEAITFPLKRFSEVEDVELKLCESDVQKNCESSSLCRCSSNPHCLDIPFSKTGLQPEISSIQRLRCVAVQMEGRRRYEALTLYFVLTGLDFIERLQEFLREDSTGTVHGPCVFQRTSQAKRIESWWGIYRRQNAGYWMDVFKELQSAGDFSGDATDKGLIQFCFLALIQDELDTVVNMWNNHRIRRSNGRDIQHGKPFLMYNLPELYQSKDYMNPLDAERLNVIIHENICLWKSDIPCDRDLYDLCVLVMGENNLQPSATATEALRLYINIRPLVRELLGI
ncbi:hypothetical protein E1301_Tti016289 [Triplophysa tibetana]|uniref:Uncharacterized protein n=1 Tax=Triplophysa tibetana TaxID=1572043 RepID=A0A5A9NCU2_9TELE|nr:hypothetical protein E1301_Tti016289 [Triplophysa tibetana]